MYDTRIAVVVPYDQETTAIGRQCQVGGLTRALYLELDPPAVTISQANIFLGPPCEKVAPGLG